MKKRYLSLICIITLMLTISGITVRASEEMSVVDGSYLTHEEESEGIATLIMRGEDLQAGYSKVSKAATRVINAGGTTTADHVVDEVGIAVVVERLKKGTSSWYYYTGWQMTKENASSVSTSRRLSVAGGYYYRVRATHWANSDASSSFTDGIYIE